MKTRLLVIVAAVSVALSIVNHASAARLADHGSYVYVDIVDRYDNGDGTSVWSHDVAVTPDQGQFLIAAQRELAGLTCPHFMYQPL